MKKIAALSLAFLMTACGAIEIVPRPARRGTVTPEVSNVILQLLDQQEAGVTTNVDYSATSLGVISQLRTPSGLRLKLRYQELGFSLVEAFKLSRDLDLLQRLVELSKWSERRQMRAQALVTLAAFSDPADVSHFRQALTDQDIGIRFAAVEAIYKWGREESLPLLREAARDAWSPLIRVFAAQSAAALGDESALGTLYAALDDRSWVVRAMAARYLGDYGQADDYAVLMKVVNQETRNDFVAAEAAIAALKLLAKKSEKPVPMPASLKGGEDDRYSVAADDVIEMEPLVIRPPRLYIPESVRVAQALNNRLIQIIQTRIEQPLDASLANDPNLADLNRMVTPDGYALQTRYSELGVAVAEGLAGTTDELLRTQLIHLAESNRSALARATALLSLAYARDRRDVSLVTRALASDDEIVRFGGMEAAQAGRFRDTIPDLLNIANTDSVPAFRLYAIQALLEFGEPSGRNLLLTHNDDPDWPARAMTFWLLGRYGESSDHGYVINQFASEQNSFVLAELALAAQRLAPTR